MIADVEAELAVLSTAGIARKSWEDYGEVIVVDSLKEAAAISNDYAPEHLEVNIETPDDIVEQLYNYGSLFIGGNTAEVFGDYASGTNHTPADGQSLPLHWRRLGRHVPQDLHTPEHEFRSIEGDCASRSQDGIRRRFGRPRKGCRSEKIMMTLFLTLPRCKRGKE